MNENHNNSKDCNEGSESFQDSDYRDSDYRKTELDIGNKKDGVEYTYTLKEKISPNFFPQSDSSYKQFSNYDPLFRSLNKYRYKYFMFGHSLEYDLFSYDNYRYMLFFLAEQKWGSLATPVEDCDRAYEDKFAFLYKPIIGDYNLKAILANILKFGLFYPTAFGSLAAVTVIGISYAASFEAITEFMADIFASIGPAGIGALSALLLAVLISSYFLGKRTADAYKLTYRRDKRDLWFKDKNGESTLNYYKGARNYICNFYSEMIFAYAVNDKTGFEINLQDFKGLGHNDVMKKLKNLATENGLTVEQVEIIKENSNALAEYKTNEILRFAEEVVRQGKQFRKQKLNELELGNLNFGAEKRELLKNGKVQYEITENEIHLKVISRDGNNKVDIGNLDFVPAQLPQLKPMPKDFPPVGSNLSNDDVSNKSKISTNSRTDKNNDNIHDC